GYWVPRCGGFVYKRHFPAAGTSRGSPSGSTRRHYEDDHYYSGRDRPNRFDGTGGETRVPGPNRLRPGPTEGSKRKEADGGVDWKGGRVREDDDRLGADGRGQEDP